MKKTIATTLGLALLAGPGALAADGYDVQVWQPVHDGSGAITTQGVQYLDTWDWRAGLSYDYARSPLRLIGATGVLAPVLSAAETGDVGFALGLPHRFTAEVDLPFAHHRIQNPLAADGSNGLTETGVGDVRVNLKSAIFDGGDFLPGLGAGGGITAPTGNGTSWFGSNVLEGRVYGIAQERLGPVMLVTNIGSHIRPKTATVWGKRVGSSLTVNGGVVWNTPIWKLDLLADGYGAYAFRSKEAPLELGGGARRELIPGLVATVGANHGFGHALGTPTYRVYGMMTWDGSLGRKRHSMDSLALAPTRKAGPSPTPAPMIAKLQPLMEPIATPLPLATPAPMVVVTKQKLELSQSIFFALQLWDIQPQSFPILDEAARQLLAHTEIRRIRIEGHTDSTGSEFVNDSLSKLRAIAVKNYLVKRGVEEGRLEATGFGPHRPIATNKTKEGRALNRRVEFNIQQRDASDDAPEAGEGDLLPQPSLPMDTTPLPPEKPIPAVKRAPKPVAKPAATPIPAPKP